MRSPPAPGAASPLADPKSDRGARDLTADATSARPPSAPSGSGSAPARRPCDLPGRSAWMMWRTLFVLDDRYVPIKARTGDR